MSSEIQNFLSYIQHGFNVSAQSDILMIMSIIFIIALAYLVYTKTNNGYNSLAAAFIGLTICTVLTFMPLTLFFIISAIFALYIAGKIFGAF